MKKQKFVKHLAEHACYFTGEQNGSHAKFRNSQTGALAIVPMHNDINDNLCRGICKQLGIPYCGKN